MAKSRKADIAKARERLVLLPEPGAVAQLARRYANHALGTIDVLPKGTGRVFDFGDWKSGMRSTPRSTTSVLCAGWIKSV